MQLAVGDIIRALESACKIDLWPWTHHLKQTAPAKGGT